MMKKEVEYIEYYDNDLEQNIKILKFEDNISQDKLEIIYKDELQRASFKALEMLSTTSFEQVPCFMIQDNLFEIDRNQYEEHLLECLNYFTDIEDYELCDKLVSINEKLKS